jgi:hypothetical protein
MKKWLALMLILVLAGGVLLHYMEEKKNSQEAARLLDVWKRARLISGASYEKGARNPTTRESAQTVIQDHQAAIREIEDLVRELQRASSPRLPKLQAMVIKAATIEADIFRHDEVFLGYIRDGAVVSYEKQLAHTDQHWDLWRQGLVMITEFCEYTKLPEKKLRFDVPGKIEEAASAWELLRGNSRGHPFMLTAKYCQAGDTLTVICKGQRGISCSFDWQKNLILEDIGLSKNNIDK